MRRAFARRRVPTPECLPLVITSALMASLYRLTGHVLKPPPDGWFNGLTTYLNPEKLVLHSYLPAALKRFGTGSLLSHRIFFSIMRTVADVSIPMLVLLVPPNHLDVEVPVLVT